MCYSHRITAFLFFFFVTSVAICQQYNDKVEATLDVKVNDEFIALTAYAQNKTSFDTSLRYVMSVNITQPDNTVTTEKIDNRFVLKANEKNVLNSVSIQRKDSLRKIVLLLVYDADNIIIGKDRIILNDPNDTSGDALQITGINVTLDEKIEDGVVLSGIVIENTKTKPGRDFYRKYSDTYRLKNINSPRIITINEIFALGTNTKIEVKVEGQIVLQFFLNPRADYIDSMSELAIKNTINHLERIKRNNNFIKKY